MLWRFATLPEIPVGKAETPVRKNQFVVPDSTPHEPLLPAGQSAFDITVDELSLLNQDKDIVTLRQRGGVEAIAEALRVDLSLGIDTSDAGQRTISLEDRVNAFGSNVMKEDDAKTFFALILEQIEGGTIIMLIFAATVSTILGLVSKEERNDGGWIDGGWIDGVAIWVAVLVMALVGAANEYQQNKQFRKLNDQAETDVTVFRDGREDLIKNGEVVVGDVLVLNTSDRVGVDGLLFYNNALVVDESIMTGENELVRKTVDRDPFCRSGTYVTAGSSRILVIAVGKRSEWGETLALATGDVDKTPLQDKLVDLAAAIGRLGLVVAIASFVAMLVKWMIEKRGFPLDEINEDGPLQFFLFAVTIVVFAVPEGLPLAVTISLSYSMQKMMKDNYFVRVLSACENMGGATCICSDTTGILTGNRMRVVEGWFQGQYYDRLPTDQELDPMFRELITENASLNSEAFLIFEENDVIKFVGNRTECALLVLTMKLNVDYQEVRSFGGIERIKVYEFSSLKRMSSVVVRKGVQLRLYNKGAAEMVLPKCTQYVDHFFITNAIIEEKQRELQQTIEEMASRGMRTLALTYRDLDRDEFNFNVQGEPLDESFGRKKGFAEAPDEDLTLLAIVGIKDPVRPEVPEAVAQCKHAGIFVRMVTGDNIHTAKHIAKECAILTDDGLALEGPTFRQRIEEDLEGLKRDLLMIQVLARSSPYDKHKFVRLLQEEGEVVAVTGNGTNDAPALREADVGLAMGIAGTEVAKEAADIVILDDDFSSIVKAVLWGRSVLTNIRKFVQFQLTINVVAMVVAFVAAVVGGETPLNVLQLLWVNLIMDSLAALALATENPTPDLLDEKPHGRDEPLLSPTMIKHILLQSAYQLVVIFVVLYSFPSFFKRDEFPDKDEFYYHYCYEDTDARYRHDPVGPFCDQYLECSSSAMKCTLFSEDELRAREITDFGFRDHIKDEYEDEHDDAELRTNSVVFNAFIFMQIFNEINARKIHDEYNIFQGVLDSSIFCAIFVGITGLQLIIMLTPMRNFFKVGELNGWEWLFSLVVGLGVIPYSTIIRFVLRMHDYVESNEYASMVP